MPQCDLLAILSVILLSAIGKIFSRIAQIGNALSVRYIRIINPIRDDLTEIHHVYSIMDKFVSIITFDFESC